MAVQFDDLVVPLKTALNPLGMGDPVTVDDAEVRFALAEGFWTAKGLFGFFPKYRADAAATTITNTVDAGVDMPREEQQIIIALTVILAWRAKLLNLPTLKKAKAGPNEVERQQSATLLRDLIAGKEAELQRLIADVKAAGRATDVGIFDLGALGAVGRDTWVR